MLSDFLKREDVKDLRTLQQKLIVGDGDTEEWLKLKGNFDDNLKISTLCRTINSFMVNRPRDMKRLKQMISIFRDKYPKFINIFDRIDMVDFDDKDDIFSDDNVSLLQQYIDEENLFDESGYYLVFSACGFGAIKCFKYLILNFSVKIDFGIISQSIIGGNMEIIHFFIQNSHKFDYSLLEYAIKSHQYEIFDWIIEKENIPLDNDFLYGLMIIEDFIYGLEKIPDCQIIDVNCPFIEYHLFRLENNVENASSALVDACEYGLVEFLKHILEHFESIDVNIVVDRDTFPTECGEITPLIMACKEKNLEIIKLLLSCKDIDVNKVVWRFDCEDYPYFSSYEVTALSSLGSSFTDGIKLLRDSGKLEAYSHIDD